MTTVATSMNHARALRLGRGTLSGLGRELGRYVLFAPAPVRATVIEKLEAPPLAILEPETIERERLERLARDLPPLERVVGAGGGMAIDSAKFVASVLGVEWISAPTILSTTAYANGNAALRSGGEITSFVGPGPSLLVVDLDLILGAPPVLNVAGFADVLSCHTASHDWQIDSDRSGQQPAFDAVAVRQGRGLIEAIASHAEDCRAMTERAAKLLVYMHMEVVEIAGASTGRVESGSEHVLVEAIERVTGRSYLHGALVGLAIDLMADLQGNEHAYITEIMEAIGLPYSPTAVRVSRRELESAIRCAAESGRSSGERTILDYGDVTEDRLRLLLDARTFEEGATCFPDTNS